MPTIYTVEIDGTQYDLEGDHPPSEAEARQAVGGMTSTPPPAAATAGTMMPSTVTDVGEPTTGENLQNVLKWGGKVVGNMIGLGSAQSTHAVENPKAFLATAALPTVLKGAPGIIARAAEKYPSAAGAVTGAAEGGLRSKGDPFTMARDGVVGALGGGLFGAAQRVMGGARPSPAPAEKPPYAPSELTANINDPDAFLAAVNRMRGSAPPKPPAPAQAKPATATDLQSELAKRIDWRTTDAVPIDAMKRDVLNGGSIIEAGESRVGLGEQLAKLMKNPTPANLAAADRLAKALRQREHISAKGASQ